jgi:hypothetical protein
MSVSSGGIKAVATGAGEGAMAERPEWEFLPSSWFN